MATKKRKVDILSFVRNAIRQNVILLNAIWLLVAPVYAVSNSLTITESGGVTTKNYPVQIGRPFVQGEILNGQLPQATVNGIAVPTQVDVKSRWGDGSLKHAVISFLIPTLSANQSVTVNFGSGTTVGNTALTQAQMLGAAYNFDATIALTRSGATKTASARVMLQNNDYVLWTSGPIVTTILLSNDAQGTTCGAQAASKYDLGFDSFCGFRPRFEAQFWTGTNQVYIRYIGEITNTEQLEDVVADNVVLTTGSANPVVAYTLPPAKSPLTMFGGSRWTKAFWMNGTPSPVGINHNLAYLAATRALPNFDTSKSVSAATVASAYSAWQATDRDLYGSGEWLSNGSCCNITSGGGHDWLGPVSSWDARWLYSGDYRAQQEALSNADLAGAFPIHYREGNTTKMIGAASGLGHVVAISSRPSISWAASTASFIGGSSNNGSAIVPVGPTSNAGWVEDPAHRPTFLTSYLLTGDPYYLDENFFWDGWAAWFANNNGSVGSDGTWRSRGPTGAEGGIVDKSNQYYQTRGQGWTFLGRVQTAWVTPDTVPEKYYFTQLTNDAIAYWEGQRNVTSTPNYQNAMWNYGYKTAFQNPDTTDNLWSSYETGVNLGLPPLHFWDLGNAGLCDNPPIDPSVSQDCTPMWMQDYVVLGLGRANDLGYAADGLLGYIGPNLIGQATDPGYNPYLTGVYRTPTVKQGSTSFASWAAVETGFLSNVQTETDFFPGAVYQNTQFDADGNIQCFAAALSFVANQSNGPAAWNWVNAKIEPAISGDLKWAVLPRSVTPPPATPVITTSSPLPAGIVGSAYSQALAATGGTPPYTWSVSIGSLPAGLSLSAGGTLTGTPTSAVTANFTIQVKDSASQSASQAFTLTVAVAGTGGKCDLNGDGVVNNLDVQIAINQALGTAPCANADLMQTGQCNVVDVQRVINASLGAQCLLGSGGVTPPPPTPPTVSVTAPQAGATLSAVATVSANATSTAGMASVQFKLDGANLGSLVSGSGPLYNTSWDTTTASNGTHTLAAFATDSSGGTALSAAVSVTVQNTPPPPPPGGGGGGTYSIGWNSLNNTMLQSVCPPDSGGYLFSFACQYVITAWSGGIADTKRNRLLLWGGGHGNYAGNEVYSLNLTSNPVTLTRLDNPSPINPDVTQCPAALPDGNPNSRHTYDGLTYLANIDKMLSFGGVVACNNGSHLEDLWSLNLANLSWQRMDPVNGASGQQPADFYTPVPPIAVYDPNTQLTFISDTNQLWSYNDSTNTYNFINGSANVPYESTAVLDPKRKMIYFIGTTGSPSGGYAGGPNGFAAISIAAGSNYAVQDWTSQVTGCDGLAQAEWPGVAYDSATDRVVGWPNFGNTVYIFNPDTKSCTTQTFPNGPPNSTDFNGVTYSTGTFGRFQYFPGLDVFALVNFWTNNAYVLRLN